MQDPSQLKQFFAGYRRMAMIYLIEWCMMELTTLNRGKTFEIESSAPREILPFWWFCIYPSWQETSEFEMGWREQNRPSCTAADKMEKNKRLSITKSVFGLFRTPYILEFNLILYVILIPELINKKHEYINIYQNIILIR